MQEILGPLDNPRYVIPREVKIISDTWLSNLMPEVLAKYFRKKKNTLSMFHSVPKVLCRNKEEAMVFQSQWNLKVSPGEIMYGHSKKGKEQVAEINRVGLVPKTSFHRKSVFL